MQAHWWAPIWSPDAEASLLHRISPLLLYHLQAIEASLKTNQYSGYFLLTWLGRVQQWRENAPNNPLQKKKKKKSLLFWGFMSRLIMCCVTWTSCCLRAASTVFKESQKARCIVYKVGEVQVFLPFAKSNGDNSLSVSISLSVSFLHHLTAHTIL